MRRLIIFLMIVAIASSIALAQTPQYKKLDDPARTGSRYEYDRIAKDRIIVKFREAYVPGIQMQKGKQKLTGISPVDNICTQYKATSIKEVFPGAKAKILDGHRYDLSGWHAIKLSKRADINKMVADLKQRPEIEYAQPVWNYRYSMNPNDPWFNNQWFLHDASGIDINAPEAWDTATTADDKIVAVLETGVRYYHKDLGGALASPSTPENSEGNMWINWPEKNGSAGIDDDGNGYIDDWIGYDFVDSVDAWPGEDGWVQDNDPRDFNGHGTHVAGLVGALNNNGNSISSVAGGWGDGTLQPAGDGVKIMALRTGYSDTLTFIFYPNDTIHVEVGFLNSATVSEGIRYAADNGADIVNLSAGGFEEDDVIVDEAVDYFMATGGLFVKSAGNGTSDIPDLLDAREDVISVAALAQNDCKAGFSNFGEWITISAPGEYILSTWHDHDNPTVDAHLYADGTSMSAPIVASVAALVWARFPDWTGDEVLEQILATADRNPYSLPCNEPAVIGEWLGAGRIDAGKAVATPPQAIITMNPPQETCSPFSATFTNESTGQIPESCEWYILDQNISNEEQLWAIGVDSINYQFVWGHHHVRLVVYGPGGRDETTTEVDVPIYLAYHEPFSAEPTSGMPPLDIQFNLNDAVGDTAWEWAYRQSGSWQVFSTERDPLHQFLGTGSYDIQLTITGPCGTRTRYYNNYLQINPGPPLDPPQLWSPVDGRTFYDGPRDVTTRCAEQDYALIYRFQLASDPAFDPEDIIATSPAIVLLTPYWTFENLPLGTYYWRAHTYNHSGWSDWSVTRHFIIYDPVVPPPSCPVLYSYDGGQFNMENTVLTACKHSGYRADVTDYYLIKNPVEQQDGTAAFQLREMEDEVTYLKSAELLTVDHPSDVKIACTVDGQITAYKEMVFPIAAVDHNGVDRLPEIAKEDGSRFSSEEEGYLVATFPKTKSGTAGFSLGAGRKIPCYEDPPGRVASADPNPDSDVIIEIMTASGEWVRLMDTPVREKEKNEQLTSEQLIADSKTDNIQLRISWKKQYSTDAVFSYIAAEQAPVIKKVATGTFSLESNDGFDIPTTVPDGENPIVLRKGEVLDITFGSVSPLPDGLERSYIIKTSGRYEPDYAVHSDLAPKEFNLYSNYPNPFNPSTTISYDVPQQSHVKVEIFDITGRLISVLADSGHEAGHFKKEWKGLDHRGNNVSSGVYFYRITAGSYVKSNKMILLR